MTWTKERLDHLAAQHHMDGGGHNWEPCDESTPDLAARGCVAWDDPDWDYLTGDRPEDVPAGTYGLSFVWSPVGDGVFSDDWAQLPDRIALPKAPGMIMRALAHGEFYPRDSDCSCMQPDPQTDVYSGHPECPHCKGSGRLDCDGGPWAVYATEPDPDYAIADVGMIGLRYTTHDRPHLIVSAGSTPWGALDDALSSAVERGLLVDDAADAIMERTDPSDEEPADGLPCVALLWLGRR